MRLKIFVEKAEIMLPRRLNLSGTSVGSFTWGDRAISRMADFISSPDTVDKRQNSKDEAELTPNILLCIMRLNLVFFTSSVPERRALSVRPNPQCISIYTIPRVLVFDPP